MKQRVDVINFFLIWLTLGLALAWPFELFLFSYIVLGPLHYLTEINWLDKQDYFVRRKDRKVFVWAMILAMLALGIGTYLPQTEHWHATKPMHDAIFTEANKNVTGLLRWCYVFALFAFVMSVAWVFTERWLMRAFIMGFCVMSIVFFYNQPLLAILFGVLLPTVIHVFVFTICFMFYGALKAKSGWGYVNVASMFLVLLVILFSNPHVPFYISQRAASLLSISDFDKLNVIINQMLGNLRKGPPDQYSREFLKMQSFIAFAYTYHYLNWFSKTSIIKWHEVSKKKLTFSAVLWVVSVGLFAVDYRLGFAATFALSVLHVQLEFPLNYVSIHGIFGALFGKVFKPVPAKSSKRVAIPKRTA